MKAKFSWLRVLYTTGGITIPVLAGFAWWALSIGREAFAQHEESVAKRAASVVFDSAHGVCSRRDSAIFVGIIGKLNDIQSTQTFNYYIQKETTPPAALARARARYVEDSAAFFRGRYRGTK